MDVLPFLSLCLPRDNGVECPSPASDSTPRYIPGIDLTGAADALNYDTWYPGAKLESDPTLLVVLSLLDQTIDALHLDRRTILNLFQLIRIYIRVII